MNKIYIVEDDPLTSSLLATALKRLSGFSVLVFDDGASAAKACAVEPPKILIIDYQLPGISGIELFELLKGNLPPECLVIMASAIDDGAMVLKFIQRGIRNYVIKDEFFIQSIYDTLVDEGIISTR